MYIEKKQFIENGFSGYLAKPSKLSKHGVVIILGGESVMLPFLKVGRQMAKVFAKEGFISLSVSLFGANGLPNSPDQIPLEYIVHAISYLKKVEKCSRISVFGMSMGSLAALGGTLFSGYVDDLIMMSPSHVAFEGTSKDRETMLGRSAFTYDGKEIAYICADFSKYKMYEAFEKAYDDKKREREAMDSLPIRDVKARVLLLAGGKDSSWPSTYSVNMLADELDKAGKKNQYQKIIYSDYGHMLLLKKKVMIQVYSWMKDRSAS